VVLGDTAAVAVEGVVVGAVVVVVVTDGWGSETTAARLSFPKTRASTATAATAPGGPLAGGGTIRRRIGASR
jgi:hypothetical protein